jgi:hypothetical protein
MKKARIPKGESIAIISFAIILITIVLSIIFIVTGSTSAKNKGRSLPTIKPPATITEINNKLPLYISENEARLLDKLKNRQPLSDEDTKAKTKILKLLPKGINSGILYQSTNTIIDYTDIIDEFQVEILTTDLNKAKAEGTDWFSQQGMSQKGICDLPVNFYLSKEVSSALQGKLGFNPLPTSCN